MKTFKDNILVKSTWNLDETAHTIHFKLCEREYSKENVCACLI